jgi:hypothetical protein
MMIPCTIWTPAWARAMTARVSVVYRLDHHRHRQLHELVSALGEREKPLGLWKRYQAIREEAESLPDSARGIARRAALQAEIEGLQRAGLPQEAPVWSEDDQRREAIEALCVCVEAIRVGAEEYAVPGDPDGRARLFGIFSTQRLFDILVGVSAGLWDEDLGKG